MSPVRRLGDRHPFEIYMLAWAEAVSAPAAVGIADPPPSVVEQLTPWPARAWVVMLAIGCATAMLGLAWKRPPRPLVTVTGLSLEQVGLFIVGWSSVLYAVAAIISVGWAALIPAGLVIGFGAASFRQSWKIHQVLRDVRAP